MAADSMSFSGGRRNPLAPGVSKISRAPDGSLFGVAGLSINAALLHAWAKAGMDFQNVPELRRQPDDLDNDTWIWLRPNGTTFAGGVDMKYAQVNTPYCIGEADAACVVYGALDGGCSLRRAIELAIVRCIYIGGDIHVFNLWP
jgi:hypothetical protein